MNKSFLVLLLSGTVLVSCNQNTTTNGTSATVDTVSEEMLRQSDSMRNEVVLTTMPQKFQATAVPDSLLVDMANNTSDTITTGMHYDIERMQDGKWMTVLPEQIFQDIGYALLPSESRRFEVRLRKDKAAYSPGSYRVVKHYLKSDYKETKQQHSVYAEFSVME